MRDELEAYLGELRSGLRVGSGRRRRIIAEVSEHLAELTAEERAGGVSRHEAARRAVARFGPVEGLTAEFNGDEARHVVGRAARGLLCCVVVALAAAQVAVGPGAPARRWPSDVMFYPVCGLLSEVALVCALNVLLLAVVAPWLRGVPLRGRPAVLAARSLAVASAAMMPVAVVAAGNVGACPVAERVLLGAVAVGVPLVAAYSSRAVRRAAWLGSVSEEDATDVLGVIVLAGRATAERWAVAGRVCRIAEDAWQVARARAPRATRWLDPRHHPWRSAATVAVLSGVGLKAPDLMLGDPDLAAVAVQAVAVYASFVLLGGLLGLRGRTHRGQAPSAVELSAL